MQAPTANVEAQAVKAVAALAAWIQLGHAALLNTAVIVKTSTTGNVYRAMPLLPPEHKDHHLPLQILLPQQQCHCLQLALSLHLRC